MTKQRVAASRGEQSDHLAANGVATIDFRCTPIDKMEDHAQRTENQENVGQQVLTLRGRRPWFRLSVASAQGQPCYHGPQKSEDGARSCQNPENVNSKILSAIWY